MKYYPKSANLQGQNIHYNVWIECNAQMVTLVRNCSILKRLIVACLEATREVAGPNHFKYLKEGEELVLVKVKVLGYPANEGVLPPHRDKDADDLRSVFPIPIPTRQFPEFEEGVPVPGVYFRPFGRFYSDIEVPFDRTFGDVAVGTVHALADGHAPCEHGVNNTCPYPMAMLTCDYRVIKPEHRGLSIVRWEHYLRTTNVASDGTEPMDTSSNADLLDLDSLPLMGDKDQMLKASKWTYG